MYRIVVGALALGFAALAGSSVADAQVEFSGRVYHMRTCVGPDRPGEARCHAHVVTDRGGNPVSHQVTRNFTPYGYGPAQLRAAYGITGMGSASITVAVVDAYGYNNAENDMNAYRQQFGLPLCHSDATGCFKKVNQRGQAYSYPSQNTGWAQESGLDLDMVSAMCPLCHIVLVEANNSSWANLATAENTAATFSPIAISNSYGGGENGTQSIEASYNHPGIAITVSSGDSGYGVQFPASSPHVTAVGGTTLVQASNTRGWSETVWSGAGSGCSSVYNRPTWQTNAIDPLCGMRTVADVSADADPNTAVAVVAPVNSHSSAWLAFGGTSVAAPMIAGIYGVNGGTPNYGSDPYNHTTSLNDVTAGSNGNCGGTYLCTGALGYDGPSGLGTPNGPSGF
jgi:subtilase family serine protease